MWKRVKKRFYTYNFYSFRYRFLIFFMVFFIIDWEKAAVSTDWQVVEWIGAIKKKRLKNLNNFVKKSFLKI